MEVALTAEAVGMVQVAVVTVVVGMATTAAAAVLTAAAVAIPVGKGCRAGREAEAGALASVEWVAVAWTAVMMAAIPAAVG